MVLNVVSYYSGIFGASTIVFKFSTIVVFCVILIYPQFFNLNFFFYKIRFFVENYIVLIRI